MKWKGGVSLSSTARSWASRYAVIFAIHTRCANYQTLSSTPAAPVYNLPSSENHSTLL